MLARNEQVPAALDKAIPSTREEHMAARTPTNIKRPLEPKSANPSQNSRLRAATDIQSAVTPEDYPEDERHAQVTAATGPRGKRAGRRGPDR
jgi:hypothetical protein